MHVLPVNDGYSGSAIMWTFSLKSVVKDLRCNHVRLCGIMIQINNCEIMCLHIYMLCVSLGCVGL